MVIVIFRGERQRPVASGCCRLECAEMKVVPTSHTLLQLLHSRRPLNQCGKPPSLVIVATAVAVFLVDYYSNDNEAVTECLIVFLNKNNCKIIVPCFMHSDVI